MKIDLNTNLVPLFTGTYESIWEVDETNDDGEQLMVDYKHEDLMKSIAEAYQNHNEVILTEMDIPFIKKLDFLGTFYSPREYNFTTDTLDFTIEVNKKELYKTLKDLKDNQEFKDYLRENFTSYDGFWSRTPNNYSDLVVEIKTQGSEFEQSIGALITFLASEAIRPENGNFYDGIEGIVHEDWRGNGYGSLNYRVCEDKYTKNPKKWGCVNKQCFNYHG